MKKLLIWDGDETLWQGTLVEGDLPTLPPGRVELCEMLSGRGVLQAVASFNRPQDVQRTLHALGLTQFFLHNECAFGKPKSVLVRSVQSSYGLARTIDVVYLDDSPFNRAEVLSAFPEIVVADPADVQTIVETYFTKDHYTEEDRRRVRRYQSEETRREAAFAYGDDYQAFLRSCGLWLRVKAMDLSEVPRVLDLIARANQMAALARTLSEPELLARKVVVGYVGDTFGEYGLSAVLIEEDPWHIGGLVVSCRLQGRGIGSAFLGTWLGSHASNVTAEWTETEYNAGMRVLYGWFQFQIETMRSVIVATRRPGPLPALPDWIDVRA